MKAGHQGYDRDSYDGLSGSGRPGRSGPYAERQLIVVVADALVAAEREAEGKAEPGDAGANSVEIANEAALAIAPGSRWRAARVRVAKIAGVTGHMVASAVRETAMAAARA